MDERQKKWDTRYMMLAYTIAGWSKDPSTQVGAVLVRPNNSIASTGYNGFPPGHDDSPELYADREYKYKHVVHAEQNAIAFYRADKEVNSARPCCGFTLYTSFPTCPVCMEEAGKAGIARIVGPILKLEGRDAEWIEEWEQKLDESERIAQRYGIEWESFGSRESRMSKEELWRSLQDWAIG